MTGAALAWHFAAPWIARMADDPAFMRKHYGELAIGFMLIDSLEQDESEAKEAGITVDQLMVRRRKEKLKMGTSRLPGEI
jgi:hypothetical protein